jgi:hypothetical protein
MSAANSTAFPIYGQAFRARAVVYSATTGLPISVGAGDITSVKISLDDGAQSSVTTFGFSGAPGVMWIDLTAGQMTANSIVISVTPNVGTQPNAFSPLVEIVPLQVGIVGSGTWWEQAIVLFEQIAVQNNAYLFNANSTNAGAQTVLNRDGSTLATGTVASTQQGTTRSQLS